MTATPRLKTSLSWRKRLLLVGLGLGCGWLLAELTLSVFGAPQSLPYEVDEFCASRLMPGLRGRWTQEGSARFQTNSAGFRDREHVFAKPPQTLRIAVLGDSYIEAFQVADDATFARVLERELNSTPLKQGQSVEVLSFGVSGWSTAQELLALRHHVWQYDPDIVLLAFLAGNDVRDNSRELASSSSFRPFFDIRQDELVPDFGFRTHPMFLAGKRPFVRQKTALINASNVLQLVQSVRRSMAERRESANQPAPERVSGAGHEAGLEECCYVEPSTPEWVDAWRLTDRLIEEMAREVHERGKHFAVMTVTSGVQVHPDESVRDALQRQLHAADLDYAERRIGVLSELAAFQFIPLNASLRAYATEHRAYLHGFSNTKLGEGHWNEVGHREAALLCAKALREQPVHQP